MENLNSDPYNLARIMCDDDEIVIQLSKILETIIQASIVKGYNPLVSVITHLASINEDGRKEYFKTIGKNNPIDLGFVRL